AVEPAIGLAGKAREPDDWNLALEAPAHGGHFDDVAGERQFDELVGALAGDDDIDVGADLAAHHLDGFVQRHAHHGPAVDLDNIVVGEDAGARGGAVVIGGNDLDEAVFHG